MSPKPVPTKPKQTHQIADPDTVLKAAQEAPAVFSIGAYFRALHVMREKGHSWRSLAEWLKQFNIEVSHVHLHRLYAKEDARLSSLSRKELRSLGMDQDMIEEWQNKRDATKRLTACDPQDQRTGDDDDDE